MQIICSGCAAAHARANYCGLRFSFLFVKALAPLQKESGEDEPGTLRASCACSNKHGTANHWLILNICPSLLPETWNLLTVLVKRSLTRPSPNTDTSICRCLKNTYKISKSACNAPAA